jgi:hypothetical protein
MSQVVAYSTGVQKSERRQSGYCEEVIAPTVSATNSGA